MFFNYISDARRLKTSIIAAIYKPIIDLTLKINSVYI